MSRRSASHRQATFESNRQAEQEREAQRQADREAAEAQTFTSTFNFADGTSSTFEFQTAEEQTRQEAFFAEGQRRGAW